MGYQSRRSQYWLRTVRGQSDDACTSPLSRCLSLSPTKGAELSSLQEDAAACAPEFYVWPHSPVTHAGSVQNLCLKTLNVKKGRAEADSTTEIGLWSRRRNEPFFCTKLSARDPKTWAGERRRRGDVAAHHVSSPHSNVSLSLTLSLGLALSPAGRPEPKLHRLALDDVRQ